MQRTDCYQTLQVRLLCHRTTSIFFEIDQADDVLGKVSALKRPTCMGLHSVVDSPSPGNYL